MFRPLQLSDFFQNLTPAQLAMLKVTLPVYKKVYKLTQKPPPGITIEKIKKFDKRADELWDTFPKKDIITTCRSSEYLNWRYIQNPRFKFDIFGAFDKNERLLGYTVAVFKEQEGVTVGLINELLALDNDFQIYKALSSHIIRTFEEKNSHAVGALMLKQLPYYQALRSSGFIFKSHDFGFVIRLIDKSLNPSYYANIKNWYLTLGDTDMV